jgi:hypothetical protein
MGRSVAFCTVVVSLGVAGGCASAYYFDDQGNELPGLPFVWNDAEGKPHLGYVRTSSGLGEATFSLKREEAGGYTTFSNNLDSTGVSELSGEVLKSAFEAGKRAAWVEIRQRLLDMDDTTPRDALLRGLEATDPRTSP